MIWKVKNLGDNTMFFQIGGHPGFNLPNLTDKDSIKGFFKIESDKEAVHYIVKGKDKYFSEKPEPILLEVGHEDLFPITQDFFKNDAVVFPSNQVKKITLFDIHKTPILTLYPNTPVFALWSSQKNAPFICLEPWWGMGDKSNFTGDISTRHWTNQLRKNESFTTSYEIKLY